MTHSLNDIVKHNAWATDQILASCRQLDEDALNSTIPGTYGSIIEIARHTIDAESAYLFRVTGFWEEFPWQRGEAVSLDVLEERAVFLARTWDTYLAGEVDTERLAEARDDEGNIYAVPSGVIIAQAFHHANEHRAQICSILGALGREVPDVSAWGYGESSGRSWVKSTALST